MKKFLITFSAPDIYNELSITAPGEPRTKCDCCGNYIEARAHVYSESIIIDAVDYEHAKRFISKLEACTVSKVYTNVGFAMSKTARLIRSQNLKITPL